MFVNVAILMSPMEVKTYRQKEKRMQLGQWFTQGMMRGHPCTLDTCLVYLLFYISVHTARTSTGHSVLGAAR